MGKGLLAAGGHASYEPAKEGYAELMLPSFFLARPRTPHR